MKTLSADRWLEITHKAGVPAAPSLDLAEAFELLQVRSRNMLIEAGGVQMPVSPVKLSGYVDQSVRTGAPDLAQHGAAIWAEFATAAVGHTCWQLSSRIGDIPSA